MSSKANLFVYSNAATLLAFSLSNTDLENVIYCSTTTDAGPIQNFIAVFIWWYSLLHERHLSSKNVLSNYLVPLFISKQSIEKHPLIMKCGFREQGVCREKTSVIYYLDHITLFVCPHIQIRSHLISKYLKALHVCVKTTFLHRF